MKMNKTIWIKDLNDLLCKYEVKDLEDLENRFKIVADLEAKLAEKEFAHNSYFEKAEATISFLQQQFNEKGKIEEQLEELKQQLAESEKKHLLDEKEWQDYCAFKHIEPQIKGCLDREREYKKQLEEKDKEITQRLVIQERDYSQDKISFALEQLEKVKELLFASAKEVTGTSVAVVRLYSINEIFDNKIRQLKEQNDV